MALLASSIVWAGQHALQAEHRNFFINLLGANGYLTSRYLLNLTWLGANTVFVGVLYSESPLLWHGSSTVSAVVVTIATTFLLAVLLIPGSPVSTNAKIAHSRHDDNLDGTELGSETRPCTDLSVQEAPAQVSALCKITSQPLLLSLVLFIAGALAGPTKRVHVFVWVPQLTLIAVGIHLQLARMRKDPRYADFLAWTRVVPFLALWQQRCHWRRLDSLVLVFGLLLAAALVGLLAGLGVFFPALGAVYAPTCIASRADDYNCQLLMLGLEFVYIGLLVVSAELGARLHIFILPTGRGPVQGTRALDVEGMAYDTLGLRPSIRVPTRAASARRSSGFTQANAGSAASVAPAS